MSETGGAESSLDIAGTEPVVSLPADVLPLEFRSNVDVYGYHALAGGWFFAGWLIHTGDDDDLPAQAMAWFDTGAVGGDAEFLFFNRNDLPPGGLGFLIFIPAEPSSEAVFRRLTVTCGFVDRNLYAAGSNASLPVSKLVPRLQFIISLCKDSGQRQAMAALLGSPADASGRGFIEFCGRHGNAGGWFISGWLAEGWAEGEAPSYASLICAEADIRGPVLASAFARSDLPENARGFIMFLRSDVMAPGALQSVGFRQGGQRITVNMLQGAPVLRETELTARLRSNLGQAKAGLTREQMLNLLAKRPYAGEDTLDAVSPAINIFVDEAISCFPDGLVLMGWMLARAGAVRGMWLRNGELSVAIPMQDAVWINRQDVLDAFAKHGFDNASCGFVAFVPGKFDLNEPLYIEVETSRCESAYRNIPRPARTGLAAIRQLMSAVDVRYEEIQPAFDKVLGPAVAALNRQRLAVRPKVTVADFGPVPQAPIISVLIPLYGRLDFVEYQLAFFSSHPGYQNVELIYILDDPPKRREAYTLFTSAWERYQVPFRAVLLERNVGFAPANNIGMEYATGTYVCYLNSDVFPGTPDWLERLVARLESDPSIGMVGPLLLYEDGTVQHRGMYFKRLPEFGNWYFCMHFDKGLRYHGGTEPAAYLSITGACMVMRRDLALRVGGFDETYAVGDFEDSDLCLKVRDMGLTCVVDPAVQLFHLERKSQQSAALNWRMNVTAFNAWQHERRWGATIAIQQGGGAIA
jgi:GT2 family glycosyltransferase